MAAARTLLGEEAWEAAFEEGMAMSAGQAVEYALSKEGAPAPERALADPRADALLTRREKEVAALVARDLTNRQIGKELVLSERTVEKPRRKPPKEAGSALQGAGGRFDERAAAPLPRPALRVPLTNNPSTDGSKDRSPRPTHAS